MELNERQICLGCRKRINLLVDGFRCLDCPFFFCAPCAAYHFGISPLERLASNLQTAAGLCRAFELGNDHARWWDSYFEGHYDNDDEPPWRPGCQRSAP